MGGQIWFGRITKHFEVRSVFGVQLLQLARRYLAEVLQAGCLVGGGRGWLVSRTAGTHVGTGLAHNVVPVGHEGRGQAQPVKQPGRVLGQGLQLQDEGVVEAAGATHLYIVTVVKLEAILKGKES